MNRRPRYLQSGDTTGGKWVVSYSDIITILLVLFVALAAQAYQERLASAAVLNAPAPISKAAPHARSIVAAEAPEPPQQKPSTTLQDAERALRARGIHPNLENRGLVISLPQAILFPSGEDRIDPAALPAIAQIVEVVSVIPNQISLVGHTDAVPIHSLRFRNNWELATARSVNLLELLTTRYGIQESRLSIASPGAYSPKGTNDTEDGRAGNRRVEIIILPEVAADTLAAAK